MKKIGTLTREKIISDIQTKVKDSNACFFLDFNKLPAFSFNKLRNNLKGAGSGVVVAKNTLIQKAFKDSGKDDLSAFLGEGTGVVLVYDKDVVKTCKTLVDFSKENENLKLKGGFLGETKVSLEEVTALAKLPPKEVLLGMAVSGIASPLTGFVCMLNNIILKFVWAIQEVKNKKAQ